MSGFHACITVLGLLEAAYLTTMILACNSDAHHRLMLITFTTY